MKNYQTIILLCFFSMLFYNCSLPADDEEKGDLKGEDTFTPELPWEGEMDKFTINSKEGIHLNDPQEDAGTAYVTIPSTSVKKHPLGIWSSPHLQSLRQQLCTILSDFFLKHSFRQFKRLLYSDRRSKR